MTKEEKEAVLNMLETLPNITAVSKLLGFGRNRIKENRLRDPEFDEAVQEALQSGYDMLEEEARRRAVDGVTEPVFFRGEQVGEIRKYSDTLLKFLLRGYRSKKFNPGAKLQVGDGERITLRMEISGD